MPPLSIRGLWIVRESMVSREEVDRALSFASESGFNHVFVQVRGAKVTNLTLVKR